MIAIQRRTLSLMILFLLGLLRVGIPWQPNDSSEAVELSKFKQRRMRDASTAPTVDQPQDRRMRRAPRCLLVRCLNDGESNIWLTVEGLVLNRDKEDHHTLLSTSTMAITTPPA